MRCARTVDGFRPLPLPGESPARRSSQSRAVHNAKLGRHRAFDRTLSYDWYAPLPPGVRREVTQNQPSTGSLLRANWCLTPPERWSTATAPWTSSSVPSKTQAPSLASPPTPPAKPTKPSTCSSLNSPTSPTTPTTSRSPTRARRTSPLPPEAESTGATWRATWKAAWIRGWWRPRPRPQRRW